jgi:hypothetical protein
MRRGWWRATLVAIALLPAVILLAVEQGDAQPGLDVQTAPVLVGSITLRTRPATSGAVVVAAIAVRSDRALHLTGLVLSVRDAQGRADDAAGRPFDFPDAGPVDLGPQSRTLTVAHQLRTHGTYSYFLEYRENGPWQVLPPYYTFTLE